MKCEKCGKSVPFAGNKSFCPQCGAPLRGTQAKQNSLAYPSQENPTVTLASKQRSHDLHNVLRALMILWTLGSINFTAVNTALAMAENAHIGGWRGDDWYFFVFFPAMAIGIVYPLFLMIQKRIRWKQWLWLLPCYLVFFLGMILESIIQSKFRDIVVDVTMFLGALLFWAVTGVLLYGKNRLPKRIKNREPEILGASDKVTIHNWFFMAAMIFCLGGAYFASVFCASDFISYGDLFAAEFCIFLLMALYTLMLSLLDRISGKQFLILIVCILTSFSGAALRSFLAKEYREIFLYEGLMLGVILYWTVLEIKLYCGRGDTRQKSAGNPISPSEERTAISIEPAEKTKIRQNSLAHPDEK